MTRYEFTKLDDMYQLLHTISLELYRIAVEARLNNVKGYDFNAAKGHAGRTVQFAAELKGYMTLQGFKASEQTIQRAPLSTLLLLLHKHIICWLYEAEGPDTAVTKWLRGLQDYLGTLAHFEAASASCLH